MLSQLGGITLLGMILGARWRRWAPVVMWTIATALMAAVAFGVVP
jgi:hypothetical protein